MNVLILLQNAWFDYCQSRNLPCTPPDKNAEAELLVIICAMFGVWIFLSAARYAIVRLRIRTAKEFREAVERLDITIPLLTSSRGRRLRPVCRSISCDLIQVTGLMEKHTSRCFHKYYFAGEQSRMKSLMKFMHENKTLRGDAIFIRMVYFIPFLVGLMERETREAANRYKSTWLPLFRQYTIENPECRDYL
jgi:hypothetical protein